jgi:hypothetical protein
MHAAEEDGARLAADAVVMPSGQEASKNIPHGIGLAARMGKTNAGVDFGLFTPRIVIFAAAWATNLNGCEHKPVSVETIP